MNPSVNDVLNCLQKYDEGHRDFYQRYAEVLTAKLHTAFQNITNVICTEDPNISGNCRWPQNAATASGPPG
jgi:hypothetical protein